MRIVENAVTHKGNHRYIAMIPYPRIIILEERMP